MNSWDKLPIEEIFSLGVGASQSTKCTPGEYPCITASSDGGIHNDYTYDREALIYAVAASGPLPRCLSSNGAFVSNDFCFILRTKDEQEKPIDYRFYQDIFSFFKDDIVPRIKAGTSKKSISQKRLSTCQLSYIDYEHQTIGEQKLNNLNECIDLLENKSAAQSSCFTQPSHAVLQETIEEKLTAEWRKGNIGREDDPDLMMKLDIEDSISVLQEAFEGKSTNVIMIQRR